MSLRTETVGFEFPDPPLIFWHLTSVDLEEVSVQSTDPTLLSLRLDPTITWFTDVRRKGRTTRVSLVSGSCYRRKEVLCTGSSWSSTKDRKKLDRNFRCTFSKDGARNQFHQGWDGSKVPSPLCYTDGRTVTFLTGSYNTGKRSLDNVVPLTHLNPRQ